MTIVEKTQTVIIAAYIRATIRYTHDIAAGKTPADALFGATNAASTVDYISLEGAQRIAATVAEEYNHYAK